MSCNELNLWGVRYGGSETFYKLMEAPITPSIDPSVTWQWNYGNWQTVNTVEIGINPLLVAQLQQQATDFYNACAGNDLGDIEQGILNQIIASQGALSSTIGNATNTIIFSMDNFNNATNDNIDSAEFAILDSINSSNVSLVTNLLNQANSIRYNISADNDLTRAEINNAVFGTGAVLDASIKENRQAINTGLDIVDNTLNAGINTIGDIVGSVGSSIGLDLQGAIGSIIPDFERIVVSVIAPVINFFERIANTFDELTYGVFGKIWDIIQGGAEFAQNIGELTLEGFEAQFNNLGGIKDKLLSGDYKSWDEFTNDLNDAQVSTDLLGWAFTILQIIPLMMSLSKLAVYPTVANLEVLAQEKAGATLLQTNELLESYRRKNLSIGAIIEQLALLGYQDERSKILIELTDKLFNENEIRNLFLRGEIDENTNDAWLARLGYDNYNSDLLKKLYEVLPTVQDLVIMAVREVFTPDIANKYGLFEDFPEDFVTHAHKIGLSRQWALNYWGAHWQLPSVMQGYWMMHRGVISENDMKELLRTQDIMPYWRDKLLAISYNPLTRVDVRRMHKVGTLNEGELKRAYLDLGYNDLNAQRMVDFTIRYNADVGDDGVSHVAELTRSVIQSAYDKGVLDRVNAKARLMDLGYSDNDAELLLDMLDYDQQLTLLPDEKQAITKRLSDMTIRAYTVRAVSRAEASNTLAENGYTSNEIEALLTIADLEHDLDFKVDIVNGVKELYYDEIVDTIDLRTILEGYDFVPDEIDRVVSELDVFKLLKGRSLTRTDARTAFKSELLTLEEYTRVLRGMGYPDKYIEIILRNDGALE